MKWADRTVITTTITTITTTISRLALVLREAMQASKSGDSKTKKCGRNENVPAAFFCGYCGKEQP